MKRVANDHEPTEIQLLREFVAVPFVVPNHDVYHCCVFCRGPATYGRDGDLTGNAQHKPKCLRQRARKFLAALDQR